MTTRESYNLSTATPRHAAGDHGYSSTLRERLSTGSRAQRAGNQTKSQQSSLKTATTLQSQLKTEFRNAVDPQSHYHSRVQGTSSNDPSDPSYKLADCLAASGSEIHEAAREEISETFQSIDEKINALSEASSATLGRVDSLYDNIAYPLSATLCHSDKRVQATITEHLSNMHNELNSASDKLKALHAQWQECVHTEQKMWQEFTDSDDSTVNTRDDFGTHERKVKTIAQNAAKELDNLDAEYRDYFQAETVKIMQQIMQD